MIVTKLEQWGYGFSDLTENVEESQVICHPTNAIINMAGNFQVGDYAQERHTANTCDIMGDRVLHVVGDVELVFPLPVWDLVIYITSDVMEPSRLSSLECFAADGDYIGGDQAAHPFGPCPDGTLPDRTTDMQYMVCMIFRTEFPGYTPRPIARAVFHPNGGNVFIGRIFAQVD